jgi:hypothetical protein
MMEAIRISETSVYFNETTQTCHFHTRRREYMNSHDFIYVCYSQLPLILSRNMISINGV